RHRVIDAGPEEVRLGVQQLPHALAGMNATRLRHRVALRQQRRRRQLLTLHHAHRTRLSTALRTMPVTSVPVLPDDRKFALHEFSLWTLVFLCVPCGSTLIFTTALILRSPPSPPPLHARYAARPHRRYL